MDHHKTTTQTSNDHNKTNAQTSTDNYKSNFILGVPRYHSESYYPNHGFMDHDENDCQLTPNNLSFVNNSTPDVENQIYYKTYENNINLNPTFRVSNPSASPYQLISKNTNLDSITEHVKVIEDSEINELLNASNDNE